MFHWPAENRMHNLRSLPPNGSSARTASDSGVPAGKTWASSPPFEELGIESNRNPRVSIWIHPSAPLRRHEVEQDELASISKRWIGRQ